MNLAQLNKDELITRVFELERNFSTMREEHIDAENGRRFTVETVQEVLEGIDETKEAYQSLFCRVRCLESRMLHHAAMP